MSEAGARSGRLLSIVLLLQGRRTATAGEIAAQLGVSLRTVYRDIAVLGRIGVPVYAESGRAGGYRLVDGYRTTLTGLTVNEALALFLIGLPAPAASLGLSAAAQAAGDKLLAALPASQRDQAGRLRDRFLLDLPAWYRSADMPAILPELSDAVLRDQQLRIRYRRWDEPREVRRLLDPYGLVVKNGTWYLVAATASARGAVRTYRVSNILDMQHTGKTFRRRPGFRLAAYWREHLDDFDRRRITGTARVRISPGLVPRLNDLGDTALRAAAAAGTIEADGWTVAELPIESPGHVAGHLIRYGGDIQVLEPVEVRAAIRELALAALEKHSAQAEPAGLSGNSGQAHRTIF